MEFYCIELSKTGSECETLASTDKGSRRGPAPTCPRCNAFVGSLTWLPPYAIDLECYGGSWVDATLVNGNHLLFSERLRDLFVQHAFTGVLDFEPVRVSVLRGGRAGPPPAYLFARLPFLPTARIDDLASGVIRQPGTRCDLCGGTSIQRADRLVVDEATWEGQDVFRAINASGWEFASERLVHACRAAGLCVDNFIPASRCSTNWPLQQPSPSES